LSLNRICEIIALKKLSKPGTVVECMEGAADNLKVGKKYTVQSFKGTSLVLSESNYAWLGTRFRKAD